MKVHKLNIPNWAILHKNHIFLFKNQAHESGNKAAWWLWIVRSRTCAPCWPLRPRLSALCWWASYVVLSIALPRASGHFGRARTTMGPAMLSMDSSLTLASDISFTIFLQCTSGGFTLSWMVAWKKRSLTSLLKAQTFTLEETRTYSGTCLKAQTFARESLLKNLLVDGTLTRCMAQLATAAHSRRGRDSSDRLVVCLRL